jgi:hypothetical protein
MTMPGLGDLAYELASHGGKIVISHLAEVWKGPPPLPSLPALPAMALPPLPALGGLAGGAVAMERPGPVPISSGVPSAGAPSSAYGSYSDQVAQGVACLACTRSHLAAAAAATQAAQAAAAQGDTTTAQAHWATAAAELDVMVLYDWSAEKLANTPPEDRAVVEALRPCVEQARAALPTPQTLAVAYGSLAESVRFAASARPTDRDRAEIAQRREVADGQAAYAERVEFVQDLAVAQALRAGRHVLDGADPYDPRALQQAAGHWHQAAAQATPALSAADARAAAAQCGSCKSEFYQRYFQLMQSRHQPPPNPA